jgi:hypothetical protein
VQHRVKLNIDLLSGQLSPADPSDLEWADGFFRALGYLLLQSNELENALLQVYKLVTDKRWEDVENDVRDLTIGQLVKRTVVEYEKRFPDGELREGLEKMKPTLKKAIDTRNAFVHARWVFVPNEKKMERERLPRGQAGVREFQLLSVADVEQAVEVVGGTADQVMEQLYDPAEIATRATRGPGEIRQR